MFVDKKLIAVIVGALAVIAGAVAAFVILKKKFGANDDFDEFDDFDAMDDDEFFDEDEFFDDDDSDYVIGSDNSMPFAGNFAEEAADEADDEEGEPGEEQL